jgi:hypothetical protein
MHPSWQARHMANNTGNIQAFAGKKMTFADDD